MYERIIARFWSKVEKTDTCWLWKASAGGHGYGQFAISRGNIVLSHRFAYEITYGAIPNDARWCVCHTCDCKLCVNPDHLWLGTDADNAADKILKGREGPYSDAHPGAKLSNEKVQTIRHLYDTKQCRVNELARRYGLEQAYTSRLVHRLIRKRG